MFLCCCGGKSKKYFKKKLDELAKKYPPINIDIICNPANYHTSGSFSSIYFGKSNSRYGNYVIKKINFDYDYPKMILAIINEIEINMTISHPNIIKMYGYTYDDEAVYLIFEKGKCDMFEAQYLYNRIDYINMLPQMIAEITKAIDYLGRIKILHRDIKLENIIICQGKFKLCDFGLSSQNINRGICGTRGYIAPEILSGKAATIKSDLWSLGMCGVYMLCDVQPYGNGKLYEIECGEWIGAFYRLLYRNEIKLIENMIALNPAKRIAIGEIPHLIDNLFSKSTQTYIL